MKKIEMTFESEYMIKAELKEYCACQGTHGFTEVYVYQVNMAWIYECGIIQQYANIP